jgi:hypothetical protein
MLPSKQQQQQKKKKKQSREQPSEQLESYQAQLRSLTRKMLKLRLTVCLLTA